ncbi:MAG: tetratricopeptide repeat protein [Anaerolineae bacterium]|nr:tetratricopeptide repeat protein [Phycisphaerae bacterium]
MKRTSPRHTVSHAVRNTVTSAALASIIGLVGCADMVTYSGKSQDKGMTQYKQQSYTDAAGSFRNATRQNPRDYKSYYMLGCCYEQSGQHQQAIHAFRTSLDVQQMVFEGKYDDEQRVKTINGLAGAIAHSDSRDIETNAAVAKARTSQNADDYMLLGQIYAFRGDADSAVEAYDHAALLAPQSFYISKSYGLYLERLGQTSRAEAALRRAYALNVSDEEVNLALRRLGVIPGPSIKNQDALVQPPLPRGPIPELDLSRMKFGGSDPKATTPAAPNAQPGPTVAAPRD